LLVEDDPAVCRFVSAQLESLGYNVTAVGSGAEALYQLSREEHFDLLLTDVVMPGDVSGVELARRARRAFGSDLKVLLTSGYPREALAAEDQPSPDMLLLRKPYQRRELEMAVQQALVSHS
jgi:CheY-like chemotaxis protein